MATHHHLRIASGLAAVLFLTAPVFAAQEKPLVIYGDPSKVGIERIYFADLDLDTVTGRKNLHHRVGAAVERVCDLELGRDGLQLPGYYACATSAWGDAAPQIARAIVRSKELAIDGTSSIATSAIVISVK